MKFCRSCHTCQVSGKPNQVIPAAPLKPIPVIEEPFEHVIIDCVGPLLKTKSGNQYILTIMCAANRFPEAVPLHSLKACAIVKALKFFSTFGLPRCIQSDQGSNFMSKIFAQVMSELKVKHHTSSAYHPESQGVLERFHQSMLRKFCTESNREWDEGLPLLLFAVRETVQESLGFSPAEAQSKMKINYDKKSVARTFQEGDRVLVLLPVVGSTLQAKFCGPYVVDQKLSE